MLYNYDACLLFLNLFQEYCQFIEEHPLKSTAAGLPIVICPLVLFSDDTSGNRSKKWNKFDYWCLTLANC